MPNWCENEVSISFTDKAQAQKFIDECCLPYPRDEKMPPPLVPGERPPEDLVYFSFKKTLPLDKLTKDGSDWDYDIAVETWGTKWDIGPQHQDPLSISDITTHLHVHMNFDTAWTPPEGIHSQLIEMGFEDIFWFFREDGVQFAGYL